MGIETERVRSEPKPPRSVWRTINVAFTCDQCGVREEDEYLPVGWIPVSVEAGEFQEEGWQVVKRVYCDICGGGILDHLVGLGFGNHFHGSTNFLEVQECPGAGYRLDVARICPTPDHGMYYDEEDNPDG